MPASKSLTATLRAGFMRKDAPAGTRQVTTGSGFWGLVRESFPGAWQRGVTVDPIGSITSNGTAFACISRISSDIAKLEMQVRVRDERTGVWREVPSGLPIHELLRQPNTYQNRFQFLTYWVASKLLYGNAYAVKVRDARGIVVALYPLDPRRVTPMVTPDGDVYYSLGGDDLSRVPAGAVLPAREVIHDRGVTLWHPLVGVSPIVACAASATQGNRIQGNSATFFENMSRPSGMLTAPATINEVTAARLKKEWEANYGGMNLGRLAVLGDGLNYQPMTIPANDAQLIEQLNWTVEDIARCFAVPLYKINAGTVPTAGNVEALESQYYSGCLQAPIEALEGCLDLGLGLPPGMRVQLDTRGLLRMDTANRYDALGKGVTGGWLTPNEARASEDLPPLPGGSSVYLQQQQFSLEALAKRDARPDPFATGSSDAAGVSRREISQEVSKALDSLIDYLPDDMRHAMLIAKDARWVRQVAGQEAQQIDGAAMAKDLSPETAGLTNAQTGAAEAQMRAAEAQMRAADAWTEAAKEQADAARQVALSAQAVKFLQEQMAAKKADGSRPWSYHMQPRRDPATGLIVGITLVPLAPVPKL